MTRTEGGAALFKGLGPALIGTAPYAALNFASYDLLKRGIFGADARCPAQPLRAAVSMFISSKECVRVYSGDCPHKAMSFQQHAAAIMQHTTILPRNTVPWSVGLCSRSGRIDMPCKMRKPIALMLSGCCSTLTVHNLGLGAASGLLASSVCFPLDTVRRQMQMRTCMYRGQADAMTCIWRSVSGTASLTARRVDIRDLHAANAAADADAHLHVLRPG
jgi:hypothetical protein